MQSFKKRINKNHHPTNPVTYIYPIYFSTAPKEKPINHEKDKVVMCKVIVNKLI